MLSRHLPISRRHCATAATLLIAGCAGSALTAQSADHQNVVVVRVIDDATRQPLVNAEIITLGTQQNSFTNDHGEARLLRPPEGSLHVRVREIGFEFADRDIPHAPGTAQIADTIVVMLQPVSYKLPKVTTEATNSCGATTDSLSESLSALVLSQLRLSAERYEAFRRAYPFTVRIERRTVRRDYYGEMKAQPFEALGTDSEKWGDPYVPGHVLSEDSHGGFSVPILFVSALADPVFWKHHCFVARGVELLDGARVIRLDFAPTKETRSPDWEGSAFVDSATSILRRVDFDLTTLARHDVLQALVGYTIFRSPAASITMPDSTVAMWWTGTPVKAGQLQPADGVQLIRVQQLVYRKSAPADAEPLLRAQP